ncbi:Peptidyl-prolyl cis-trans isomerase fpr2 [Mucor velutinosus]|uniref:Peptidyl-prolyl cis-trans isomerase fpr2 n=1 Tax=Mucor velutinosus TaxID=708070 RepID=A0AAN7HT20_9FUNG|nr:Peptidyl-prolyl cis-trans isomerase fpr2 [Mucor velutinosus]
MVSIKTFLASSVALIVAFANVEAAVSPTYPSPGTIQIEGQSYDITWTFDGKDPKTTYTIDFMTGSNDAQTKLQTVATKVPANQLKYSFVAPQVSPNSAIYFFMFTGSDGVSAWTTRFGIAGADGKLVAETEKTQPNGDAIPWGTGKLLSGAAVSANASSAVSATASVSSVSSVIPVASSSVASSSADIAVAVASSSASATVMPAAASTPVPSVAQVVPNNNSSSATMVKPALTLVSAAVAAYFAL